MRVMVLGRGKTGALVGEVARQRGHDVIAVGSAENENAAALTPRALGNSDVVIDFTTPRAVLHNVDACAREGTRMVVGTTGWYAELPRIRRLVERSGMGFVYASNFSLGMNLLFQMAPAAAPALACGFRGSILERHHVHQKDAPSGAAVVLQKVVHEASRTALPITSEREGEVVGFHSVTLESPDETITLTHEAMSRRSFAEGAVRAAEWLQGRTGFYDFRNIFSQLNGGPASPKRRPTPRQRAAKPRRTPRGR